MSIYTNKAILSLLNMTKEMFRKNIEISRISKTSATLILSGLSPKSIDKAIIERCVNTQFEDGGFVGNSDTIWNICLLKHFNEYSANVVGALKWLSLNAKETGGFGRSKRDMARIPVSGLLLYLLPELASEKHLNWLENTWLSELNSLTYKASYTLMAFKQNYYIPKQKGLVTSTLKWLTEQQEDSGGFAPWKGHPVGSNVYCTAIAALGLLSYGTDIYKHNILQAYNYMKSTQLKSGVWPYHEIEDGSSWGLYAMTKIEETFGESIL